MKIIVNYNSYLLRHLTNKHSEELEVNKDSDLKGIIGLMQKKYGEEFKNTVIDKNTGKIRFQVLIDGKSISGLDYKLKNKNRVNFLALVTGG